MFAIRYFILSSLLLATSVVQPILHESEYTDKLQNLSKILHSSCAAVSGIDEAMLNRVKNGDVPDDPTLKKYLKCLFISSTAMTENGELNKEFMMEVMPVKYRPAVSNMVDTCAPKVKDASDLENKAFVFFKCILTENADIVPFF